MWHAATTFPEKIKFAVQSVTPDSFEDQGEKTQH